MTAAETLRAAAEKLRDRSYFERTGEPDASLAFDTALADWLDATADEMTAADGTEYEHAEYPSWTAALAVAHAVLGEVASGGEC